MLWDWLQSLHPRSAQGTGTDRPEGTLATGVVEFLGAWVLLVSVTSGVGADFVSSSMIPGVLALGVDLLWVLWDWLWSSHPSSAQDIGPDWKEPMPLVRQSSTFDFSTETLKYRRA